MNSHETLMNHSSDNEKPPSAKRGLSDDYLASECDVTSAAVTMPPPKRAVSCAANTRQTPPPADPVGIREPQEHDVLCARGGLANYHPGNVLFRKLVDENKELYRTMTIRNKGLLSKSIVRAITSQKHRGRFLRKDNSTGLWFEINVKEAIEKTSQAFRDCDRPPLESNPIPDNSGINTSQQRHHRLPSQDDMEEFQPADDDMEELLGVDCSGIHTMLDDFLAELFPNDNRTNLDLQVVLTERIAADKSTSPFENDTLEHGEEDATPLNS